MRRHLVVLLLLAVAVPATANSDNPTVLVLGDSLSAGYNIDRNDGWVSLLQKRLQDKGYAYQVVNASISGDTSRNGLSRLPGLLQQHQPDIVIIELGGNDGLRGLPITTLRHNLGEMVRLAREHGAKVLLARVRIPPNLGPAYRDQFEAAFATLAEQQHVDMVPYILKGVADDPALMQADGLHPTAEAQPRVLDNVWPRLQPLLSR
jgi:acyl-CoA thioesterase-1